METLTKAEFKKQIIEYFKKGSGLTITEAKKQIQLQIKKDIYDTDIKAGNVRLFYTDNSNFCQGKKNGYGPGYYLSNVGFTGGGYVKM